MAWRHPAVLFIQIERVGVIGHKHTTETRAGFEDGVFEIGAGTAVSLVIAGFYLYRHVRNRPQRMQEQFVRRASKIPEVRVIAFRDRQISVVIDRPVAQLYGRLHGYLNACNKRLYSGQPMTMTILHEASPEQTRTLLSGPGVHYVRDDVVESK